MLIWTLVQPRVTWTTAEREQRLFRVCVQVQAVLSQRYPGYRIPNVQDIPAALVDEVKEILSDRLPGADPADPGPAPGPDPDL